MITMNSNIKSFKESKLSEEKYNLLMQYICHERNFLYSFSQYYKLDSFPLFYLDRYKGWRYSEGGEPILPSFNGFSDFLDEYVREYQMVSKESLYEQLKLLFTEGHRVAVDIWLEHTDGTPYTTAILLEGMDDFEKIYYTKINVTINRTYVEMNFDELKKKVNIDSEGLTKLTVIKDSQEIKVLAEMGPLQAFNHVFKELYKYKFVGEQLYKSNEKVEYDLSGFDNLISYLEQSMNEIVTESGVPKHHEISLSRHIENKLTPIQSCLQYILNTSELRKMISKELAEELNDSLDELNKKLKSLLKFASLLIQRPQASFYEMYLKSVKELRAFLPGFQDIHNKVLVSLSNN